MPSHDRAAANNSHLHATASSQPATVQPATPHPSLQNRTGHHGNPRVLIGWQNRIARFFGRDA
jgi:hypothetical protein